MPHIFFERLERRRSTQSLLGNIPTNGLMGSSSFAPSAQSGITGTYSFSNEPIIYCYFAGPPIDLKPPIEDMGPIFGPFKPSIWQNPWQQIWLNPLYPSPSWNYLNNWLSPIQNYQQTPMNYFPSWNYLNNWIFPIANYPQTPSIPNYPWNSYMYNLSKLNNVRKDLLAFFRKKGILSDKQRQRLLSRPFEKA